MSFQTSVIVREIAERETIRERLLLKPDPDKQTQLTEFLSDRYSQYPFEFCRDPLLISVRSSREFCFHVQLAIALMRQLHRVE